MRSLPKFIGAFELLEWLATDRRLMGLKVSNSHGEITKERVQQVLESIWDYVEGVVIDQRKSSPMSCVWHEGSDSPRLSIYNLRVRDIQHRVAHRSSTPSITTDNVKEAFGDLETLGIFQDRRGSKTQGRTLWQFDLKFHSQDTAFIELLRYSCRAYMSHKALTLA